MDDVIGLTLRLHRETKNKILVSESGYLNDAVWLPKPKIFFRLRGNASRLSAFPRAA